MEACLNVEKEQDKVLKKYKAIREHTDTTLGDLANHISNLQNEIVNSNQDELSQLQCQILTQSAKKVKDTVTRLATEHKELHGGISKIGKAIDRNFISDNTACSHSGVFEGEKSVLLNEVICEHLLRQGRLDIAEELIKEAHLHLDSSKKEPFQELNRILEACRNHNLDPALEWAKARHSELKERGSSLEFKLHKLKFLDYLKQGQQEEAIRYSRHFTEFAAANTKDIQQLMACLMYTKTGIENSPYSYLLDPVHWIDICDLFARDACALLGLSLESPLQVCITAGCIALPSLLQIKQVIQQKQVPGVWSSKDELPVEVDLGHQYRYHSIFACPILRQQCSDSNPPVRLTCGHVISQDALYKLTNGNKVKCPYCPLEMSPSEAREIRFY
ncbi:E3 ubiquitin-protein ligase RMND5A-like [Actinia tenebrosa]|uniref:E3 ubiquitin-protein ligase RMND5A-like n=1 Tax=Actinia tenebrosa TaxID=6105 RepID=A0A6P8H2D1_ACTTE|nr:E3 ubiquitin-protein ligase RMND5A-like [Actinia tenebrosa]